MASDIDFTTVMATKGVKVIPTIHTLLDADYPLFSRLRLEVVLEDLIDFPCVRLEVGAA